MRREPGLWINRIRALAESLYPLLPIRGLVSIAAALAFVAALAGVYLISQHTVTLEVNGVRFSHRTHQRTAAGVLREMGLTLDDADQLAAPDEAALASGAPIRVTLARTATMVHDGSISQARTQALTVRGAIADLGVVISPHDELLLAGKPCALDAPLPAPAPAGRSSVRTWAEALRKPVQLNVRRAVEMSVQDGPIPMTFYTTARTVGEALYGREFVIYEGDQVYPGLDAAVTPGLVVYLQRSKPVTLDVGGEARLLRTLHKTVRELLDAEAVTLGPNDYVLPDPRAAIARDLRIAVVRVVEEYHIEEIPIAFEIVFEPDAEMEIDTSRVAEWGREGAQRRRIRVHYENNRETYRVEEEAWVALRPVNRVTKYGTAIVLRQLETPSGTITYWRHLRMLATSYSAGTAGVSPTNRHYGYTRLGLRATKGIVAVDPTVVSLGQQVYVPDYGVALAGDTGGAIKGRRIDLCFDDSALEFWYRWVDVYVLAPAPPASQINWRIPNTPKEKG